MTAALKPLREALRRAADRGRTIRVWLRDDDCVAPTPALDRLAAICDAVSLPVLLAVIPEPAEATLVAWIAAHPGFAPCQHGFAHANHAVAGARAIELGGARPADATVAELARGRAKLQALFGARLCDILVPPWNRIDPMLVEHLGALGLAALSTICASPSRPSTNRVATPGGAFRRLDCDLDIMDWRHGRVGRALAEVADAAARVIEGKDSIGLLTHHLAHDAGAWAVLKEIAESLAAHPAVRLTSAARLLGETEGATPP